MQGRSSSSVNPASSQFMQRNPGEILFELMKLSSLAFQLQAGCVLHHPPAEFSAQINRKYNPTEMYCINLLVNERGFGDF